LLRRGIQSVHRADWTEDKCRHCMQLVDLEKDTKMSGETTKTLSPGKIPAGKGWTQWELSFRNYLSTILGQSGVPLNYVPREISDTRKTVVNDNDSEDQDIDNVTVLI
jgi:hypothetical protein